MPLVPCIVPSVPSLRTFPGEKWIFVKLLQKMINWFWFNTPKVYFVWGWLRRKNLHISSMLTTVLTAHLALNSCFWRWPVFDCVDMQNRFNNADWERVTNKTRKKHFTYDNDKILHTLEELTFRFLIFGKTLFHLPNVFFFSLQFDTFCNKV